MLTGLAASLLAAGTWRPAFGAGTAVESRAVSGFDTVRWDAVGELLIEQTQREHLSVEAEPAVLAKVVVEVRQGRLTIGFAPGRIQTSLPIRFRLEVKSLLELESRTSGDIRMGPLATSELRLLLSGSGDLQLAHLSARSLLVRQDGSGAIGIGGGAVLAQRVVIAGSGDYTAPRLASREADVAIEGSGVIRIAASERLSARITGSGDVLFVGNPRVQQTVTGAGEVRRLSGP